MSSQEREKYQLLTSKIKLLIINYPTDTILRTPFLNTVKTIFKKQFVKKGEKDLWKHIKSKDGNISIIFLKVLFLNRVNSEGDPG